MIVSPSLLMPPFCSVGTSDARIGTTFLPAASMLTSVSNVSRLRNVSVVNAERIGLSVFGDR